MRWPLMIVLVAAVVGCGDQQKSKPAAVQTTCVEGVNCGGAAQTYRHCSSVVRGFRACTVFPPNGSERTRIERRASSGWVTVVRPHDVPVSGWWRRAIPSPDRTMLLGQWSGDCEIQTTYLIHLGKRPRSIFSQAESFAVGWSKDGRARVHVTDEAKDPRGDVRPGIYRIHPRTLAHTLERSLARGPAC